MWNEEVAGTCTMRDGYGSAAAVLCSSARLGSALLNLCKALLAVRHLILFRLQMKSTKSFLLTEYTLR